MSAQILHDARSLAVFPSYLFMEDAMRGQPLAHTSKTRRPAVAGASSAPLPSILGWHGPTLREFAEQIEHEFGRNVDLSGLRLSGLASDEALDPSDIRSLCELLGLPAEDFGVS